MNSGFVGGATPPTPPVRSASSVRQSSPINFPTLNESQESNLSSLCVVIFSSHILRRVLEPNGYSVTSNDLDVLALLRAIHPEFTEAHAEFLQQCCTLDKVQENAEQGIDNMSLQYSMSEDSRKIMINIFDALFELLDEQYVYYKSNANGEHRLSNQMTLNNYFKNLLLLFGYRSCNLYTFLNHKPSSINDTQPLVYLVDGLDITNMQVEYQDNISAAKIIICVGGISAENSTLAGIVLNPSLPQCESSTNFQGGEFSLRQSKLKNIHIYGDINYKQFSLYRTDSEGLSIRNMRCNTLDMQHSSHEGAYIEGLVCADRSYLNGVKINGNISASNFGNVYLPNADFTGAEFGQNVTFGNLLFDQDIHGVVTNDQKSGKEFSDILWSITTIADDKIREQLLKNLFGHYDKENFLQQITISNENIIAIIKSFGSNGMGRYFSLLQKYSNLVNKLADATKDLLSTSRHNYSEEMIAGLIKMLSNVITYYDSFRSHDSSFFIISIHLALGKSKDKKILSLANDLYKIYLHHRPILSNLELMYIKSSKEKELEYDSTESLMAKGLFIQHKDDAGIASVLWITRACLEDIVAGRDLTVNNNSKVQGLTYFVLDGTLESRQTFKPKTVVVADVNPTTKKRTHDEMQADSRTVTLDQLREMFALLKVKPQQAPKIIPV